MNGDFGTDDIITGRGLGISGFGGYGYGTGAFSGPTANALRIEEGNRQSAANFENLLDQNQFAVTNDSIVRSCNRVTDTTNNSEFRMADRLRDIEREMNANAREAASCCCDVKVQAANDKAEMLQAIAASETRAIERDRNTLQAELISLRSQVACTTASAS